MSGAPELRAAADVLVQDYMAVTASEEVLVTIDTATDFAAAEALFSGVLAAGAKPTILQIPQLPFQGTLADKFVPDALAGAVSRCGVWIDLTFPYLAGSSVHDEAMRSQSVRYLLGGDMHSGGLTRLFGAVDLDQFQQAFDVYTETLCVNEGAKIRVTCPLGTDVTYSLGKAAYGKPRRALKPGTYLVPGSCTMFPEIDSVQGKIVTPAGFHEYFTEFSTPITIEVDGRIRSVTGGGADRKVLDRSLHRAGGGKYGYVIHFTFAMHPAARFTGGSFIEDSRVHGMNAVGLGLPWWVPGGGENHPDVVVADQSIYVNDVLVIDGGAAMYPPRLVEAAAILDQSKDTRLEAYAANALSENSQAGGAS
ncbi:MAG: hypothetical protein RIM33_03640 [Alphaproteobacteria bacterium]